MKIQPEKSELNTLLACPFCGERPYKCHNGNGQHIAKCYNCGVIMTQDRPDKLISLWNTRVTRDRTAIIKKIESKSIEMRNEVLFLGDENTYSKYVLLDDVKEILSTDL